MRNDDFLQSPLFRSADPEGRAHRLFDYLVPGRAPDAWVFGYGSLMWDPGFPHIEAVPARLQGYHRRFCVYSYRYRGTPEKPGLVLGLDRGGACNGIAYRVAASDLADISTYLWHREMGNGVYRAAPRRLRLDSREIDALCFVANPANPQYAGHLDRLQVAAIVSHAVGGRGACREYLLNTLERLRAMGLRDRSLLAVARLVTALDEGRMAVPALPPAPADPEHF
ncbi:MAG: gamma-glutamylcyclotransferase [Oceanibaculum nanhaiense]|uniref:gamma-glutamylcyclotransferase n=1 Tax=Oceanibaculum nanhaiense TaxID=1909734 RepID=UPI0025A39761|nr:gamma-glutamylcyclotransferase [Oceanibaculum nanhaiense]MDM7945191.1 gamma-glutamylcyclotransferase [Oceanibaculum nanhaiense]